jgi:choline kinase
MLAVVLASGAGERLRNERGTLNVDEPAAQLLG